MGARHSLATASSSLPAAFPDSKFESEHPPDIAGQESAEHARVWKVYREEMSKQEAVKLDGWNRLFDVLLTFVRVFQCQRCCGLI